MLFDRFDRTIDYLRISVTDRCNHRCLYCMPDGIVLRHRREILSYENIVNIAKVAVKLGIKKIRLTGGEPLIRKGIENLVKDIAVIDGLDEVCMTTNGTYLAEKANLLAQNGLSRVNVSIDTLDGEKYRRITGGGDIKRTLEGVQAAVAAGLGPVKINMVVSKETTEQQVEQMSSFCAENGLALQLIMQFSLYDRDDVTAKFETSRPPKCNICNRLRLTADGYLKSCLFSDNEIKVDHNDIAGSIKKAVQSKPQRGIACNNRTMMQIGG